MFKRKLLLIIVIVFSLMIGACKKEEDIVNISLENLNIDLTNTKALALARNYNDATLNLNFSFFQEVKASDTGIISNDYDLVKVNEDDTVESVKILDDNTEIEFNFTPVYLSRMGNFTVVYFINNKVFDKSAEEHQAMPFFYENLRKLNNPSYTINDILNHDGEYGYYSNENGIPLSDRHSMVFFIHNTTGKFFEYNDVMFNYPDFSNTMSVIDTKFTNDTIEVILRGASETGDKYMISTITYDTSTDKMSKELFSPNLSTDSFYPFKILNNNEVLFLSQNEYRILKKDNTVQKIAEGKFKTDGESIPLYVDDELYFLYYDIDGQNGQHVTALTSELYKVNSDYSITTIFSGLFDFKGDDYQPINDYWKYLEYVRDLPYYLYYSGYKNCGDTYNNHADKVCVRDIHIDEDNFTIVKGDGKIFNLNLESQKFEFKILDPTSEIVKDNLQVISIEGHKYFIGDSGVFTFNYDDYSINPIINNVQIDVDSTNYNQGYIDVAYMEENRLIPNHLFINPITGDYYLEEGSINRDIIFISPLN